MTVSDSIDAITAAVIQCTYGKRCDIYAISEMQSSSFTHAVVVCTHSGDLL